MLRLTKLSAHYCQDILPFWTRSSVFLLVSLLALVNAALEKHAGTISVFTIMGIGVSLVVWFSSCARLPSGSRYGEFKTVEIDDRVNPLKSYSVDAPPNTIRLVRLVAGRPAQIGQFLPVVFILGWLVLFITR